MNQYQFEQVCRRMEKRYGKIRKGEESRHEEGLRAIETSLLTVHRPHHARVFHAKTLGTKIVAKYRFTFLNPLR